MGSINLFNLKRHQELRFVKNQIFLHYKGCDINLSDMIQKSLKVRELYVLHRNRARIFFFWILSIFFILLGLLGIFLALFDDYVLDDSMYAIGSFVLGISIFFLSLHRFKRLYITDKYMFLNEIFDGLNVTAPQSHKASNGKNDDV